MDPLSLLLVAGPVSVVVVLMIAACLVQIVPAKYVRVTRNAVTLKKRILNQGMQFITPLESTLELQLPIGARVVPVSDFPSDASSNYRYDPAPYEVLTQDQVATWVDLWIQYSVSDVDKATDYPVNFRMLLDDAVRARTQELASEIARPKLNAVDLGRRLAACKWPEQNGLTIRHVGVQGIQFDERMQAILRAQSAGLTTDDIVQMNMSDALRYNKNTHVMLDHGGAADTRAARRARDRGENK